MLLYLSGRMSGIKDFNAPLFNATAKFLRNIGFSVINPIELSSMVDSACKKCKIQAQWSDYLKVDLRNLTLCDGIVMLPGYRKSRGAMLELLVACELELKLFSWNGFALEFLSDTQRVKIEDLILG